MKKITVILFLSLLPVAVFSQEKNVPRTEFLIELSTPELQVAAGESKEITMSLLRSRAYSKSKPTFGVTSSLPAGVEVTFEAPESTSDKVTVKITTAKEVKPGSYLVILNSAMQNKRKGATLRLTVESKTADPVISNN